MIIGDVHGLFDKYYNLVKDQKYSLQIGDFGFSREWNKLNYSGLDSKSHKVLGGNHDCYDSYPNSPYALGDFGEFTLWDKFFFIRGGYSIDGGFRRLERSSKGKTWWGQEQLRYDQMCACEHKYSLSKPETVITHTPPNFIIQEIGSPRIMQQFGYDPDFKCQTSVFLEWLFGVHVPKKWIFAHMHKSYANEINGCLFIGLSELEVLHV